MPLPDQRLALYDQLAAPRRHLDVLIAPAPELLPTLAKRDYAAQLDAVPLLDSSIGRLRRRLHERLELYGPVILTGHQAEFFHAGVFAKAIVADALAEVTGGVPVYLTVDSDTPKSTLLPTPQVRDNAAQRVATPIPGCVLDLPMDQQPPVATDQWRHFFAQLRRDVPLAGDSLLDAFEHGWFSECRPEITPVDGFMRAHIAAERALGLRGAVPLRTSRIALTPEFRSFAAHLLLHAERFRDDYNAAQAAYRRRRRVRSLQRPVPPLARHGDRVELPLWIVPQQGPRRRLFAARRGEIVVLLADNTPVGEIGTDELRSNERHQHEWPHETHGWQLRPRALTLSAFCRLLLCDLFIHGIGGAKYDEVTEDFVERFFGVPAPPMACATASLLLPLPAPDVHPDDLNRARHARRDAWFNPGRRLADVPGALLDEHARLVREAQQLKDHAPLAHASRRENYRALHACLHRIRHEAAPHLRTLDERIAVIEAQLRANEIAADREYFYALHPRAELVRLRDRLRDAIHTSPE